MQPASPPLLPLPPSPASFYMQLLTPCCCRRPGSVRDHHASRTIKEILKRKHAEITNGGEPLLSGPSLIAADSTHWRRHYQGSTQRQRRRRTGGRVALRKAQKVSGSFVPEASVDHRRQSPLPPDKLVCWTASQEKNCFSKTL